MRLEKDQEMCEHVNAMLDQLRAIREKIYKDNHVKVAFQSHTMPLINALDARPEQEASCSG